MYKRCVNFIMDCFIRALRRVRSNVLHKLRSDDAIVFTWFVHASMLVNVSLLWYVTCGCSRRALSIFTIPSSECQSTQSLDCLCIEGSVVVAVCAGYRVLRW